MSQPTDVVAEIEISNAPSADDLILLIQLLRCADCWEVGHVYEPSESESELFRERTAEVDDA